MRFLISFLWSYVSPLWKPQQPSVDLNLLQFGTEQSAADVELQKQCAEFCALDHRVYKACQFYLYAQPLTLGLPMLLSLMLNTLNRGKHGFNILSLCVAFGPWLGLFAWALLVGGRMGERLRTQAKALIASGDVRVIGPLIDSRGMKTASDQVIVDDGLIALLPRLQPEEAAFLTAKQRRLLCERLATPLQKAPPNPVSSQQQEYARAVALRIAILQALTHFGDGEALPVVTCLAQREIRSEAERGLQEAAQTCLTAITRRVEQQRNPHILLRASSAVDSDGSVLLRTIAASPTEPQPEQLLRPGSHSN